MTEIFWPIGDRRGIAIVLLANASKNHLVNKPLFSYKLNIPLPHDLKYYKQNAMILLMNFRSCWMLRAACNSLVACFFKDL